MRCTHVDREPGARAYCLAPTWQESSQSIAWSSPASAHRGSARGPRGAGKNTSRSRLRAPLSSALAPPPDVTTILDPDWSRRQEAIRHKGRTKTVPTRLVR
ncbi:hypothetical protein NDU88_004699 [Pleurodeles waltl]|uniref:Uncharacterized protein n=1 Tax=Pleurodeles waltl TaxID=8319 RepID=A0AAV7UHH3_PLEWA|nr:hypothetical protein NDU88_000944 [Pleurodeles waltl]KAJ1187934.1 hypothetical protein NDU88_004699 [Pleurodeles waltl]